MLSRFQKRPEFFKNVHWVLGFYFILDFFWIFLIFLFERAVGKLVGRLSSSAKLLVRFASILDYLKKFANSLFIGR